MLQLLELHAALQSRSPLSQHVTMHLLMDGRPRTASCASVVPACICA
jgi:hypothetical protein